MYPVPLECHQTVTMLVHQSHAPHTPPRILKTSWRWRTVTNGKNMMQIDVYNLSSAKSLLSRKTKLQYSGHPWKACSETFQLIILVLLFTAFQGPGRRQQHMSTIRVLVGYILCPNKNSKMLHFPNGMAQSWPLSSLFISNFITSHYSFGSFIDDTWRSSALRRNSNGLPHIYYLYSFPVCFVVHWGTHWNLEGFSHFSQFTSVIQL